MDILLVTKQNSLGLHLQDALKKFNAKTMLLDSKEGDYVFSSYENLSIQETFDELIFILDYQEWAFDYNQQVVWNNFFTDKMFYKIFSHLFNVMTQIKFKNFILVSTQHATDPNSVYGFWYRKAEEILTWFCKLNNKEYTIFRVYDLIGCKAKYSADANSLSYRFMAATATGVFYYSAVNQGDTEEYEQYRPVHIIDVCNAIKNAMKHPSNTVEHLCGKEVYTIDSLLDLYQQVNLLNIRKILIEQPILNKNYLKEITPSIFLKEKFEPKDWVRLRKKDFDTLNIIK
jgi:hypothetical protein